MTKRKPKNYTSEFKADAVQLFYANGRSFSKLSRELGVHESSLREWVLKHERDSSHAGLPTSIHETEQQELHRLRKENKRLLMERDILKKAAAFFAKESL